jgi:putative membrane protein
MNFEVVKALHIVFVVSWFAGLFYMVRLFIYHVEAQKDESEKRIILSHQYHIMERKLWYVITWPAMLGSLLFGTWMLVIHPAFLALPWMHLKLGFVFVLCIYHLICHRIFIQFKHNSYKWSSIQLRLWNELATLLLVTIVFLVVMKSSLNWIWGTIGFFGVGLLLMAGIKIYKRFNAKKPLEK